MEPYRGPVLVISGLCFVYFYDIFASRCMKLTKFSLKRHAWSYSLIVLTTATLLELDLFCLMDTFGIVWWYFANWRATWDPCSCYKEIVWWPSIWKQHLMSYKFALLQADSLYGYLWLFYIFPNCILLNLGALAWTPHCVGSQKRYQNIYGAFIWNVGQSCSHIPKPFFG